MATPSRRFVSIAACATIALIMPAYASIQSCSSRQ
jgi:hypothetical protein